MAALEQRLLKLEKSLGLHQGERRVFIIRFQTAPEPEPLTGMEVGNVHFRRLAEENEQGFIDRVVQTAPPPGRDTMLHILMETA